RDVEQDLPAVGGDPHSWSPGGTPPSQPGGVIGISPRAARASTSLLCATSRARTAEALPNRRRIHHTSSATATTPTSTIHQDSGVTASPARPKARTATAIPVATHVKKLPAATAPGRW